MVYSMSTPKHKKLARQRMHAEQKRKREYEAFMKPIKTYKEEFKPYVPPQVFRRNSDTITTVSTSNAIPTGNSTPRAEPKVYTGDYIVGIATMHKSNLVPVGRGTDPKEFSTMRRN